MTKNLKTNRIIFLVFGLLCLFIGFAIPLLFYVGIALLWLAWKTNKAYKASLTKPKKPPVEPKKITFEKPLEVKKESPYEFFSFKVAGVTFKNGRKSRQAILRAFKWGDEEIERVDLEDYEYKGSPAVYVKINGQIVGNVPANLVGKYLEMEKTHIRDNISCNVYGGSKLDDGSRTSYGCEVWVRYIKREA